jgi:hypothetical protein
MHHRDTPLALIPLPRLLQVRSLLLRLLANQPRRLRRPPRGVAIVYMLNL